MKVWFIFIFFFPPLFFLEAELFIEDWMQTENAPFLQAKSAILVEQTTRTVLYEKDADRPLVPASLTKLITFYVALKAYEEGDFSLNDDLLVSPQSYGSAQPAGSSLMHLGAKHKVSGRELLKGLMIGSGNDAALEIALRVSGSKKAFVQRMNDEVRLLGYKQMIFFDSAGLDARNSITAREMAAFTLFLYDYVGDGLMPYISSKEFVYSVDELPQTHEFRYKNRNPLLGTYEGAEGVKTGYTEEAGYTFVASALRDERRLIAVLLSIQTESFFEGIRLRQEEAQTLLDFGFSAFTTESLELDPVQFFIAGSSESWISVSPRSYVLLTLPQEKHAQVIVKASSDLNLWAPLTSAQKIGNLSYFLDDYLIHEEALYPIDEVKKSHIFRRFAHYIRSLGNSPVIRIEPLPIQ